MAGRTEQTTLAVIKNDIGYIKDDIKALRNMQETNYVTNDQFEPVKRIVYGLVTLILIAVVGALVSLVVRQQ